LATSFAIVLLVVAIAPSVMGQGTAGSGPDDPLAPTTDWTAVAPNSHVWFAFDYAFQPDQKCELDCVDACKPKEGHQDVKKDCEKNCKEKCHLNHVHIDPMFIEMFSVPKTAGASFCVMTPYEVSVWKATGKFECAGQGTPNKNLHSQLSWAGNFTSSGTYCVVVNGSRTAKEPVEVMLKLHGFGCSQ
jgi:hypothetical protein